jgi:hypothetical protein
MLGLDFSTPARLSLEDLYAAWVLNLTKICISTTKHRQPLVRAQRLWNWFTDHPKSLGEDVLYLSPTFDIENDADELITNPFLSGPGLQASVRHQPPTQSPFGDVTTYRVNPLPVSTSYGLIEERR